MLKGLALYRNELYKIARRKVGYVFAILVVAIMIAVCGIFYLVNQANMDELTEVDDKVVITELKDKQETIEKSITKLKEMLKKQPTEDTKWRLRRLENDQAVGKIAITLNIDPTLDMSYCGDGLRYSTKLRDRMLLEEMQGNDVTFYKESIEKLEKVILAKDYQGYMQTMKEINSNDPSLAESERKVVADNLDLQFAADPDGKGGSNLSQFLRSIKLVELSIADGVDYSRNGAYPTILTKYQIDQLKNAVAVDKYKLQDTDNNTEYLSSIKKNISDESLFSTLSSTGALFVVILMIILAGGSMAQEYSDGTIKTLVLSPFKRWKIVFSKFMSLVTVGLIFSLFAYLVAMVIYVVTGHDMLPYVYASDGVAHSMSFFLYTFLSAMIEYFVNLLYIALAFVLSTTTRSIGASISVPLCVYYLLGTAINWIYNFLPGNWILFVPNTHMDLSSRIFSFGGGKSVMSYMNVSSIDLHIPSIPFSVIYILILLIFMVAISIDSLKRRDL